MSPFRPLVFPDVLALTCIPGTRLFHADLVREAEAVCRPPLFSSPVADLPGSLLMAEVEGSGSPV